MNWLVDHWKALTLIEHGVIGIYLAVWHGGGLKTIWRNFWGPKEEKK
jgi:hypothetical protein